MELREFPRDDNLTLRLIGENLCEFAECSLDPVDGFVEDDRSFFRGEGSEECLSSFFNREESQVEKLIDGEAGSGERCEERGGTRDRC